MVLIAPKTTHSRIAHRHRKHQAFRTGTDKRKTWCLFGVLIGKTRGYEPIRCTVSDTTKPHETGVFQRYSTMPLSRITAREERLLYGKNADKCGNYGTFQRGMVFGWCLNLCDTVIRG